MPSQRLLILGIGALLLMSSSTAAADPISPLFLTTAEHDRLFLINGNAITTVVGAGSFESAIAVGSDVRTLAAYTTAEQSSAAGAGYNLSLTPTGATYSNDFGSQLLDGTTDGVFNYAVQWNTGRVIRFDTNWANGEVVATGLELDTIGITYDPFTDTFWTTSRQANAVSHFSRTWNLLGSFEVIGDTSPTGLAFDPADRTLWLLQQDLRNQLAQYSTEGILLSTVVYTPVSEHNTLGAEFALGPALAPIPEPTSLLLLGTGVLGLLGRHRWRHSSTARHRVDSESGFRRDKPVAH